MYVLFQRQIFSVGCWLYVNWNKEPSVWDGIVLFYLDENSIQDYESDEKFSISDDRISHLLPTSYQDMIVRVYSKKPELVGAISEAFENFQVKTYGIKAQVHATPEKKIRRR
ncbi:hypothetical protein CK203_010960 [Vitis vinifera]|uniref:Uncharacterized protein n=1 Tax=Vitis vinifera TaxID=29760 RepID=A0A438JIW0_VITVI|nr:hypothetical protein CK203_067270 [Vitis vinifera]RVX08884.1 hypothetical protein CK203_010960 [Vitis vinifera]